MPGWDPEDHPRSVLSGRTNDEVKADPDRLWRSDLPPDQASVSLRPEPGAGPDIAGPDARRARRARRARQQRELGGVRPAAAADQPGQGDFPGRDGEPAVTKRELIRYAAVIAPVILPYLAGRPLNMHRFPGGAGGTGFWHKQLPDHAPDWVPRWHNPEAGPGQDRHLPGDRRARRAGLGGELRRAGVARLDRARERAEDARPTRSSTSTPGRDVLGGRAGARPAAPHRARAPRRPGAAEGHRPARHPDLDPGLAPG